MVSSAVYRYFPSRDDLITELLVICYTELAEEVEAAETEVTDRSDRLGRWLAIARTVRRWAVAHPYDYALLYGSPVPGYAAPRRTVEPAARIPRLVIALVSENDAVPALPTAGADGDRLHDALRGIREFAGVDLDNERAMRGLQAWSGLIGAITLELFGHLANGVTDFDTWFDALARRLAPA